ncbi:rRNA adenine N(6)-methyltransferase family protein [Reyranella sp.]|uniref:ribosomal RNA small subunit methyltransferase A n=1 Tax=Reyranella sp. TaxID=1929291 RepID=UPI002F932D57
MSARRRTDRDWRRRRLGQNFLDPATADRIVEDARLTPGELVVEIGAGSGALTLALARRAVRVIAIEPDPDWARRLREQTGGHRVRVVGGDVLAVTLPREPFRVMGSLPFGRTTDILRCLLDDPATSLRRADLIVQWEVALKRAATPPSTLLSTAWAPWWEMHLARRIPAAAFRPVPRVDAGLLVITRRDPPLLPVAMARPYAAFVQREWPFPRSGVGHR